MRRALVVERPGSLALLERPELEPGPAEVVVRPVFCGVCGSDLELVRGEIDPAFVRYPLTLGHEWAGTVEAVGKDVVGIVPGQRCVSEGIVPCGRCAQCLAGATNVCEIYDEVGFTREGAAGDQMLVPARIVHSLADQVDLLDAALTEPAAVVFTGLEKIGLREGERVLVIGDGTIALLATLFVARSSPRELHVSGRRSEQAELAATVGASSFSVTGAPAPPYDLVIEAAGQSAAVEAAVDSTRRGGRVLLLGLPPAGGRITFPADLLVNNDLTITASFGYTSAAWAHVVELLNAGRIAPGQIVTHRFPIEQFAEAFAALVSTAGPRGKVLLEVAGG